MPRQAVSWQATDTFFLDEELPELMLSPPVVIDLSDRPILAAVYKICGVVISVLGPLFWAFNDLEGWFGTGET